MLTPCLPCRVECHDFFFHRTSYQNLGGLELDPAVRLFAKPPRFSCFGLELAVHHVYGAEVNFVAVSQLNAIFRNLTAVYPRAAGAVLVEQAEVIAFQHEHRMLPRNGQVVAESDISTWKGNGRCES